MNTFMNNPSARPFADHDWDCFSGAEHWGDGPAAEATEEQRPVLISWREDYLFLAGAGRVELHSARMDSWAMDIASPNQRAAIIFLNGLVLHTSEFGWDPAEYGFTRVEY